MKGFSGLRIESNYYAIFVIPSQNQSDFFVGAFMGAIFTRNTNKTNKKHHVNRGYDSESGTTYLKKPAYGLVFFCNTDSPSNSVRLFAARRSPLRGQRDKRAVQRLRRESGSGTIICIKARWLRDENLNGRKMQGPVIRNILILRCFKSVCTG
jgi:hypothetical protein